MSVVRQLRMLAVLSALVGGGLALWRRRDKVRETWDRLGGTQGITDSAGKLVESMGPVRNLVGQVSHLKK